MLRVPPKFLELHSGHKPEEPIDAHAVQPYYTLLLAREAGMTISIHATRRGDRATLRSAGMTARPAIYRKLYLTDFSACLRKSATLLAYRWQSALRDYALQGSGK